MHGETCRTWCQQMRLKSLVAALDQHWPVAAADDWDNVGLAVGISDAQIANVLLSVDITREVLAEAVNLDCQLIISHHPLLLDGVIAITDDSYRGELVISAISKGISIYSAHTNADITETGVSAALAKHLGLENLTALNSEAVGHGRIGSCAPVTVTKLVSKLQQILPTTKTGIRVIGKSDTSVSAIGLVAGSGMSFHQQAFDLGADVFITSDLKHHAALDFKEQYPDKVLIEISHFAAESLWLEQARWELEQQHSDVKFLVCSVNTDPWDSLFTND